MPLTRRLVLLAPLAVAACGDDALLRQDFPPLRYDYLTRLELNVATVSYGDLPPPGPLDSLDPAPPGPALLRLLQDRLVAGGSSGQARVTVGEARVTRDRDSLDGAMAVRVDIVAADGTTAGFAEARVARHLTGIGNDLRGALYDFTKQMLDDMNVELEFQLRRTLKDYLQTTTTAPPPAPVQQEDLLAPAPAPLTTGAPVTTP